MKSYKCTECGESFKEKTALVKHEKIHPGDRLFKCSSCKKEFSKKLSLALHQRIHTKLKLFACNDCGRTFSQKSGLISHFKTHIAKEVKEVNKKGQSCVSKHPKRIRHRREKSYKCLECKKTFVFHRNLIKHQKSHAKVMPQSPDIAGLPVEQKAENEAVDQSGFMLQELRKMRENVDMFIINQQSQLCVLQGIQKQLSILVPGNDIINSNVYSLGCMLAQQAAAIGSTSFPPLINPNSLLPERTQPPFSSHMSS